MAMRSFVLAFALAITALGGSIAQAQSQPTVPQTSVPEIIARNAAARGGVDAWRNMQTMAWAGHVESAASPDRDLPFMLEQKRPDRTRFELITDGQRSLRIYDGKAGWKIRPTSSGRPETLPYSEDELRFAHGAQVIDGPLMDYVAKGAVITLAGLDEIDGRKAHVLEVRLPSGGDHRLWIDVQTYLEMRQDRQVGSSLGKPQRTTVYYRNYKTFEGLQMPTTIETVEAKGTGRNRLVIERVALNPDLEDSIFAKPLTPVSRRNSVVVDTRTAAQSPR
jgi:outer membrane lipoprotein-sorting protein